MTVPGLAERTEASWLATTAGVKALDDVALIRVFDDDRRSWLNGQITNDVSKLAHGAGVYALTVNLRGRILADLWAFAREDDLVLAVPAASRDALMAHYDRYIVMEDVEIEPLDTHGVLSVQGPRAAELTKGLGGHSADRLGHGGVDLLLDHDALAATRHELELRAGRIGGGAVSDAGWERARILAGIPRFGVDFGDATLPQEAGLAHRAVSFVKGCYLGQEVVCMLENRGKLRRRLVCLEAEEPLEMGTPLTMHGRPMGEVTSVVNDAGRWWAIGLVKTKASEPETSLDAAGTRAIVRAVVGQAR